MCRATRRATGHDGYTLLPSFVNIPNEYIEVYAPLLVERYDPVPDTGGPGLHRGGNGIWTTFLFREAGDVSVHDSRWLTHPWGANGGQPGARSRKILVSVDGTETILPAVFDRLPVQAGDRLHFITWGGGGWGDPLKGFRGCGPGSPLRLRDACRGAPLRRRAYPPITGSIRKPRTPCGPTWPQPARWFP